MPGLRHADAAARAAKPRQGAGGLALAETTATPGTHARCRQLSHV